MEDAEPSIDDVDEILVPKAIGDGTCSAGRTPGFLQGLPERGLSPLGRGDDRERGAGVFHREVARHLRVHPGLGEPGLYRFGIGRSQFDALTSTANRRRQSIGRPGGQHDETLGRGFLKGFQQRVRGVGVHPIRVLDHGDLAPGDLGRVDQEIDDATHVVDLHQTAFRLNPAKIRMCDLPGAASRFEVHQLQGQCVRNPFFAPAPLPMHKERMGQPIPDGVNPRQGILNPRRFVHADTRNRSTAARIWP